MFIFTKTRDKDNEFDVTEVQMTVDSPALDDILRELGHFLKASGFVLPEGDNPIILNEEEE